MRMCFMCVHNFIRSKSPRILVQKRLFPSCKDRRVRGYTIMPEDIMLPQLPSQPCDILAPGCSVEELHVWMFLRDLLNSGGDTSFIVQSYLCVCECVCVCMCVCLCTCEFFLCLSVSVCLYVWVCVSVFLSVGVCLWMAHVGMRPICNCIAISGNWSKTRW